MRGGQITINSTARVDTEGVQDIIGTGLNATSGLSKRYDDVGLNYRDSDNTIDIGVTGINLVLLLSYRCYS